MGNFRAVARAMQDQAIVAAQMVERMNRQSEENSTKRGRMEVDLEYLKFSEFRKVNPPSFRGTFNPDAADEWIMKIEKVYLVLAFFNKQQVAFATYILQLDAKFWWKGMKSLLESSRT